MILLVACASEALVDTETEASAIDGAAYSVRWSGQLGENDLGWIVELSEATFADYQVSLVPCATASLSVLAEANAGHGEAFDDSAVIGPWRAELGEDLELGEADFGADWYCHVHVLSSGFGEETLVLRGQALRGDEVVDFDVSTGLAYGELYDLDATGEGSWAEVVLERRMATLFQGVDFATEDDLVWAVMSNLYAHQRVAVELVEHDHDSGGH